jgi:hypothetical protein
MAGSHANDSARRYFCFRHKEHLDFSFARQKAATEID